ncbi:MAG TPA: O-antigen ligase family protein [Steroidobacteraceae bacterium]|jgi:hypothetical protein
MLLASLVAGLFTLRAGAKPDARLLVSYFKQPALLWLGAFVLVNVVSVYYSGLMSMVNELQFWDVYAIFVAISLFMLKDVASLRQYVWGTIVGSAFVVFYAIWAVAVHAPTIIEGRAGAYGMYQNQNDYSFIIVMVMPFAYLYLRLCRHWWQRAFLAAVLIGGVVGTILSLSRGGVLALVLEAGLLLWVTLRGGRRVVALAALAVIGTGVSIHQFAARAADQAGQYTLADSENSRYELWRAARAAFEAHPILGVGSRRFSEVAPEYGSISHDNRGKVAHNTYLEVAADTGVLGVLTFLVMIFAALKSFRRARLAMATGDGLVETQVAGFVTLGCILFRATLDAKVYDWSFYFLVVIGVATSALASRSTRADARVAIAVSSQATAEQAPPAAGRPAVYRLR